ncbi:MAG TPA: hypothetical protein ENG01_00045 [Candidatus Aenigmarchaeota archaeon]|nr:hypothetical protein [Candidatus Aenigmarchaeota archaeon]HEX32792.1 hypothetical protein [Candidatus Aenigmarchaeota archaeon]
MKNIIIPPYTDYIQGIGVVMNLLAKSSPKDVYEYPIDYLRELNNMVVFKVGDDYKLIKHGKCNLSTGIEIEYLTPQFVIFCPCCGETWHPNGFSVWYSKQMSGTYDVEPVARVIDTMLAVSFPSTLKASKIKALVSNPNLKVYHLERMGLLERIGNEYKSVESMVDLLDIDVNWKQRVDYVRRLDAPLTKIAKRDKEIFYGIRKRLLPTRRQKYKKPTLDDYLR